jgi:predicted nucleic acid-binding Zn ribbon protein
MAIREYRCPACGWTVEQIELKQTNPTPLCVECPAAHRRDVKMECLISVPAQPQFKGSGFYSTDYKKSS